MVDNRDAGSILHKETPLFWGLWRFKGVLWSHTEEFTIMAWFGASVNNDRTSLFVITVVNLLQRHLVQDGFPVKTWWSGCLQRNDLSMITKRTDNLTERENTVRNCFIWKWEWYVTCILSKVMIAGNMVLELSTFSLRFGCSTNWDNWADTYKESVYTPL